MALYTKEEVTAEIALWKQALSACATGKTYTIDGRQLTRYDLAEIRRHLLWLADVEAAIDGQQTTILARPMVRR